MRRVGLTAQARQDLTRIRTWQSQPGAGAAAKRRVQRILAAVSRLAEHPCLFPFGPHDGVREFSVEGHRILYQVFPDTGRNQTAGDVVVLRIYGPGQTRD